MADKKYELEFGFSDGTSRKVPFTAPQGPGGKTAYEYAKEGGYTGTESEFAAKMAADAVSVTYDAATKTLNISSVSGGDS